MTPALSAWVRFDWSDPFVRKRLVAMLLIALLPGGVCLAFGQGLLALLVMAIGTWPFPFRLSVEETGITCRWLFVKQTIAYSEVTFVRLIQDPRRWALFRGSVLALGRRGARDLLVFAREPALRKIELAVQQIPSKAFLGCRNVDDAFSRLT
ncbi:MAG TPA: hypothetical protein VJN18_05330 [Polyangiaceae bacterium]|nr:hypothetical protein [Polyangiaceae bacterium]